MNRGKEFEMELLKRVIKDYTKAKDRKDKTEVLTKYCELTGISREAAKKRFKRFIKREDTKSNTTSQRGRKKIYTSMHEEVIQVCWENLLCPCGERLHPVIAETIDRLHREGPLRHYPEDVLEETRRISLGTLKRILSGFEKPVFRKRQKGSAFIYTRVPIKADFGKNAYLEPGYIEVDFVEHNGGSSSGRFAITGVYTDLYTQWTVRGCGWGKNLESMKTIDEIVHKRIPFAVHHYHPDNDKSILKVLFERVRTNENLSLSRSRPYKKNDNAHVEQKGGDKVRKLVGYFRYDTEEEVSLLNQIYAVSDTLENFFVPTMKLKCRIKDEKGRTIKKVYEKAKTPYQRILEAPHVPDEVKDHLRRQYNKLSLVELKRRLDELLFELLSKKLRTKLKRIRGQNYDLTNTKFQGQGILI
ncbi:MAG: hypothetical protein D6710_11950 [Nitrospirae bacterium]|nr:MAG: hypothetical protein D6710_11950 [Nitrospirota bacterium]